MTANRYHSPTKAASAPADVSHSLGALSHDLTANLMVLEASLKQLKKSCDETPLDGLAQGFAQVDACLRESKRFLDDLRLLSRSGQVQLEPSPLDLHDVVRGVLEEQAPLLAERKIRVEVASPLPNFWCNETRAKQLLTNLVRNAVLHGCHPRRPRIEISATLQSGPDPTSPPTAPLPSWVWTRVYDNGLGIPAKHRQAVFQPGERLAPARSAGTGMGLAIVAQIVEHFRGRVWIDDTPQGTAVIFSLPAAPTVAPARTPLVLPEPHLFRSSSVERRERSRG